MDGKIVYLQKSKYEILDPEEEKLLCYVKQFYARCGRDSQLTNYLYNAFTHSGNPYVTTLKLSYCSGDFLSSRPKSLALFIVDKLAEWVKQNMVQPLGDTQIMLDALRLTLEQKNNSLRDLVIRTFNMSSERESFVPFIKDLIEKRKYKDACQIADILNLHSYFSAEDLLLPLLVQDKVKIVEDFVSNDKEALQKFLAYMDDILAENTFDRVSAIARSKNVPEWKPEKCGHKPIIKFMTRLLKRHHLPPSACPKMELRRKFSALHYLIAKRFDGDDGTECWEEMVLDCVGECSKMQLELVDRLCQRGEFEEACMFANKFGLTDDSLSPLLVSYKTENTPEPPSPRKNVKLLNNSGFEYYKLSLSEDKVILVDTEHLFDDFMERLTDVDLVGLDTEWKPSLITTNELALIQVATRTESYVIDRLTLNRLIPEKIRERLVEGLFHNKKILKLGFDFSTDIRTLQLVLPELKEIPHLIDLSSLRKILKDKHKFQFPYGCAINDGPGGKLKNLVEMCFGQTLDKSEQCSNWERRPLRRAQIQYAALDAYCLIEIYDVIRTECERQEIPLQEVTDQLMYQPARVARPKPGKHVTSPKDLKFICTWELAVLHKKLRRCGIDTLYNNSRQPKKQHLKLLQKDYVALTTVSQPWLNSSLNSHLVPAVDAERQLDRVLKEFHVQVRLDDTTSRCTECNGTEFETLTKENVQNIRDHLEKVAHSTTNYMPAEESITETDEYGNFSEDEYEEEEEEYRAPTHALIQGPVAHTLTGAPMLVRDVPPAVLEKISQFFVCQRCGVLTWPTTVRDMFLYD